MDVPPTRREQYLAAAATAVELVSLPEVASAWGRPSALPDWSVGGLAAHLLGQVFSVTATLAHPTSGTDPVELRTHYQRVPWRGVVQDEPANAQIRAAGDSSAAAGPGELVHRARAELAVLDRDLPLVAGDRVVQPPWTQWALKLDDFLASRLMEIAVHSDDLAVSVGVGTPALPDDVEQLVRHLLVDLAAERHGSNAVLRSLARAERAPASIAAI